MRVYGNGEENPQSFNEYMGCEELLCSESDKDTSDRILPSRNLQSNRREYTQHTLLINIKFKN